MNPYDSRQPPATVLDFPPLLVSEAVTDDERRAFLAAFERVCSRIRYLPTEFDLCVS